MQLRADAAQAVETLRRELLPLNGDRIARFRHILQGRALRASAVSFRRGTAIGSDDVDFDWIANLPDVMLDALSDSMMVWATTLTLPDMLLSHLMAVIPNKGGRQSPTGGHHRLTLAHIHGVCLQGGGLAVGCCSSTT